MFWDDCGFLCGNPSLGFVDEVPDYSYTRDANEEVGVTSGEDRNSLLVGGLLLTSGTATLVATLRGTLF